MSDRDTDGRSSALAAAAARIALYLHELGVSKAAFARRLRCTREHVSQIVSGRRVPGLKLAFAIERETRDWARGPIVASEWLDTGADQTVVSAAGEPASSPTLFDLAMDSIVAACPPLDGSPYEPKDALVGLERIEKWAAFARSAVERGVDDRQLRAICVTVADVNKAISKIDAKAPSWSQSVVRIIDQMFTFADACIADDAAARTHAAEMAFQVGLGLARQTSPRNHAPRMEQRRREIVGAIEFYRTSDRNRDRATFAITKALEPNTRKPARGDSWKNFKNQRDKYRKKASSSEND